MLLHAGCLGQGRLGTLALRGRKTRPGEVFLSIEPSPVDPSCRLHWGQVWPFIPNPRGSCWPPSALLSQDPSAGTGQEGPFPPKPGPEGLCRWGKKGLIRTGEPPPQDKPASLASQKPGDPTRIMALERAGYRWSPPKSPSSFKVGLKIPTSLPTRAEAARDLQQSVKLGSKST